MKVAYVRAMLWVIRLEPDPLKREDMLAPIALETGIAHERLRELLYA